MMEEILMFFASHGAETAIALVVGYLLGSINFAILITKSQSHVDIRRYGSGNAGMTNVMRTVGKKAGYITFIGDFLKGLIATCLGMFIFLMMDSGGSISQVIDTSLYGSADWKIGGYIGGFACIIGHMFPLYYQFKGGKGIVAAASMMVVTDWRMILIILAIFIIVFAIGRIISLASIVCAASYTFIHVGLTYFVDYKNAPDEYSAVYCIITTALVFVLAMSVIIKHRENIKRLLNGTEKKFTIKKEG